MPLDKADYEWMEFLVGYAEDWDRTFRTTRTTYFTQDYWYLFTACIIGEQQKTPLSMTDAASKMRVSLSPGAKKERIDLAVTDGWLVEERSTTDARSKLLLPTDKLRTAMKAHLERTRQEALKRLAR